MKCLQLFRWPPNKTHYHPAATGMANPTSVKLGKRARSSLQRTVSRDSLSDLHKLNVLDVLAPIDDMQPTETGTEPPLQEEEFPLVGGEWAEPVKASLESLSLDDRVELIQGVKSPHREVLRELGQGEENNDKGRLLADASRVSGQGNKSPVQPKRKWWAMGARAQPAAASKLPIPSSKPVKSPHSKPDVEPLNKTPASRAADEVSKTALREPTYLSSPPEMEIVQTDTSPKWAGSQGQPDSPPQSIAAERFKQLERDDRQCAEAQAQKYGARTAAYVRKEQVSERLHHAAHRSPKKNQAAGGALKSPGGRLMSPGGRLMSPTLSPIVYCRHDSGQELAEVLLACRGCRRGLDSKKDIYMYGGEKAFCSVSCRSKVIAREEMAQACNTKAKQRVAAPMLPRLW